MRQITSITSNSESVAVDHCPPAHPFTPHPTFSKALTRQSSKDSSLQHTNRLKTQLLAWSKSKIGSLLSDHCRCERRTRKVAGRPKPDSHTSGVQRAIVSSNFVPLRISVPLALVA